ncbi:MAG: class I SAM-dependent methyltransferase [Lachnobacterium sp.]|nr:class I SAM-dependent methyltransferase [Lachnobacterium sp.]
MDAYTSFASVYDLFMDNVPYEEWCAFLCKILAQHGITDGPVLDLGCGTGKMTRLMSEQGYDMTGIDNAAEMLQIAAMEPGEVPILYLLQDMQDLELDGCVRAVYSVCDCVNYVLDEEELQQAFSRVHEYLEEDGVFIFDVNTSYKYTKLLAENTFAESRDEGSFIWDNYYDEEERINEYDLTLFIPEGDELYRRYTETHYQRNYETATLLKLLKNAGFTDICVYDDYTDAPLCETSERAVFVAKKSK